jgi:hypothetical protein
MLATNCEKWPERWNEIYDREMDYYEKFGCDLADPAHYDKLEAKYDMFEELLEDYKLAASEIAKDDNFCRLLALVAACIRDRGNVKEDLKVVLPQNADPETDLVYDVRLTGDGLTAPLQAGDVVGQVVVTYNGSVVGKADLTVTEDFSTSIFLLGLMGFKDYLLSRPFVITVIIFVLLLLLYIRLVKGPGGRYDMRVVNRRRVKLVKRRYR